MKTADAVIKYIATASGLVAGGAEAIGTAETGIGALAAPAVDAGVSGFVRLIGAFLVGIRGEQDHGTRGQ
jgi:hypothetical protein